VYYANLVKEINLVSLIKQGKTSIGHNLEVYFQTDPEHIFRIAPVNWKSAWLFDINEWRLTSSDDKGRGSIRKQDLEKFHLAIGQAFQYNWQSESGTRQETSSPITQILRVTAMRCEEKMGYEEPAQIVRLYKAKRNEL